MREIHKKQLDKLNHDTDRILSSFETLDDALLQRNGSGWSVIQVLAHLEMSEAGTLNYMQKKMQAGLKMKKTNWIQKLKMSLMNVLQSTNLRWKAPSYIAQPPNEYTLEQISDKWKKTRADVTSYVEDYPNELMNRLVFKHPMAGRQALTEAIGSIIYHQRHHVHQLKRIRKELDF